MRIAVSVLAVTWMCGSLSAQQMDPRRGPPGCNPVATRTMELGCYVVASTPLPNLAGTSHFWHLDTYPTRAEAEAAKSEHGTVVESFGKVWLFTIADQGWRAPGGQHVGEVGPLVIKPEIKHTAAYLEAVMFPGAETSVHYHPGPEALFPLTGEECMETSDGKVLGQPYKSSIIVPGHVTHKMTITGKEKRTSLGVILHESSEPLTFQGHEHGWKPKGLCKAD